ncbi:MAG: OFA family MFS transporter [Syntrophotaleaceae bacterium]
MFTKEKASGKYILAGMGIFACMGTIYSWSVFRKPLEDLMGIGATESGWPYILFLCFYALGMPLGGGLIEKFGPRVTTLMGGTILSLAWFASGSADTISTLSLTYGVLGGTGVGLVYGAPLAVAARWFPRKKGLAVGCTLAGFGVSPFVTAPLALQLIERFGVMVTFRIFGIIFFICITGLALFLKFPQADEKQEENSVAAASQSAGILSLLRCWQFYGLWTCYAAGTFSGLMAISVTSPVAQEIIHLGPKAAALTVSSFALFNALGRPLFGFLTDRFGARLSISAVFLLILSASGALLLAESGDVVIYFGAFSLLWLALGGWLAIAPVATADLFGALRYCRNYGFVFTAYGVGALAGGLASGLAKDLFGSYQYAFFATAFLAVMGMLVNLALIPGKASFDQARKNGSARSAPHNRREHANLMNRLLANQRAD